MPAPLATALAPGSADERAGSPMPIGPIPTGGRAGRDIDTRPLWRARTWGTGLAIGVVAAIALLDRVTGAALGLTIAYAAPVLATAYLFGLGPSLLTAAAASAVWLAADLRLGDAGPAAVVSSGLIRAAVLAGCAAFVARQRHVRRGFANANAPLLARADHESRLARLDELTQLANARGFLEVVETELARARRDARPICVFYLDLDDFKGLNDRYGHSAGDGCLREVARALRAALRAGDVPARIAGDEFAVLLWNVDPAGARAVAARVQDGVADVARRYPGVALGVTLGVAFFSRAPDDPRGLLAVADRVMYEAKRSGKGGVRLWTDGEPPGTATPTA